MAPHFLSLVIAALSVASVSSAPGLDLDLGDLFGNGGECPSDTLKNLNSLAKAHGRYFGTAVGDIRTSNDTKYINLSKNFKHFGEFTPENAMKWESVEPTRNVFNFELADWLVNWGKKNGQAVRGHTFVWHSQLAPWVTAGNFDNSTLIGIMNNHIEKVGGHYKGKLYAWDVVNEMLNDDGTYRQSVFYNTIGPAYIPIALRTARKTDPKAKLYINDYNVESISAKSDAYVALSKSIIKDYKAPLDGFGIQGHLIVGSSPTADQVAANMKRFTDLGLEVAITELDIRLNLPSTHANQAQQATDYANAVKGCLLTKGCVGVQTWQTSDDYSWVPGVFAGQGDALLFDLNKYPKPAYFAVADVLKAAKIDGGFKGFPKN